MKRKTIGRVTAAVAIGLLSTTALAATQMGNNSNKGSLVIGPRVDVRAGVDTLITLVNDASTAVNVKCYYRSSSPVTTNFNGQNGTGGGTGGNKYTVDFGFRLTHNQAITWAASGGVVLGTTGASAGTAIAPPFGTFPQGAATTGEIKCWAVDGNNLPVAHNHLFMDVSIVGSPFGTGGQAWEYMAWAFQAVPNTQTVNGISGRTAAEQVVAPNQNGALFGTVPGEAIAALLLDGRSYDSCPNMLLGAFQPTGTTGGTIGTDTTGAIFAPSIATPAAPGAPGAGINISLASCMQDLTESPFRFITKYLYTIWNQDEAQRTGWFECADSWYESYLGFSPFTFANVGTQTGYFRIESVGDTSACGSTARHFGFVGVKSSANAGGTFVRGTNLVGRGTVGANPNDPTDNCGLNGISTASLTQGGIASSATYDPQRACAIVYNPGPGDSFKK